MAKHSGFTARTKARKRAADILFEAESRGLTSSPRKLRDLLDERKVISAAQTPLPPYAAEIVEGVADRLAQIDSLIAKRERKGGLDRLPGVDLAIMRVAVWEMMANDDFDPVIAIDEAVSIAKAVSTENSPATVNAILDAIRGDLSTKNETDLATVSADISDMSAEDAADLDELLDEY